MSRYVGQSNSLSTGKELAPSTRYEHMQRFDRLPGKPLQKRWPRPLFRAHAMFMPRSFYNRLADFIVCVLSICYTVVLRTRAMAWMPNPKGNARIVVVGVKFPCARKLCSGQCGGLSCVKAVFVKD